jgi:uncharacterized membrane protein
MTMGHPLFLLAIATFVVVGIVAVWSLTSTLRQMKHGSNVSGIGGPNDPLA